MKVLPFQSNYRPDFAVVEQRQGKFTLFPHTDQLPLLLRAINLEFTTHLPGRVARADHRADDFLKMVRSDAVAVYTAYVNEARRDRIRLFPVLDQNRVARVAIVQQITEHAKLGRAHHFRFYAGEDFFPEIYLSGKRIVFAEHVLERFSSRVPNRVGADLSVLLHDFFYLPPISLPVTWGRAFIILYQESILAFPYKESATEYFLTTCLTVNEIDALGRGVQAYNFHYGPDFTPPAYRHWKPSEFMEERIKRWKNKIQPPPPHEPLREGEWNQMAQRVFDIQKSKSGRPHGPGSRFLFLDNIPSPMFLEIGPKQKEPHYDELALEPLPEEKPRNDGASVPLL